MEMMEIFLLMVAWGIVGFLYFVNLTGSDVFDKISDRARLIILSIFFPTTIAILIMMGIEKIIKKIKGEKDIA